MVDITGIACKNTCNPPPFTGLALKTPSLEGVRRGILQRFGRVCPLIANPVLFQESEMNPESIWIWLYLAALDQAGSNSHTLYSSRIDGCLLPW